MTRAPPAPHATIQTQLAALAETAFDHSMNNLLTVILVTVALPIASVDAQPYAMPPPAPGRQLIMPPDPTSHRHVGLFLRPDLGVGFMSTAQPTGTASGNITMSGPAGVFGFIIGGAVAENIILGAHFYDSVIVNPSVSYSGQLGNTSDTSLALYGMGPAFTYYWMPSNIYLSATLALTRMTLTVNGYSGDSSVGLGTRLAVGKEWWVSDHWGLGLAGHLSSSWNDSGDYSGTTLSTWAFAVAFSATYN